MDRLFIELANNRVPEVKVVLSAVVVALAAYQIALIAVGYGKIRLPFLSPSSASFTHRTMGDAIVPVALLVAVVCLSYFDEAFEEAALHGILGVLLFAVLALKIAVLRWWKSLDRFLPLLGSSVFVLFVMTTITAFGD
ncbi:MAG TPA: DUF6529 family protein [Actinomycetota bacterium]|nr:DUF6529 family protein [Actinomycetota bacterium]